MAVLTPFRDALPSPRDYPGEVTFPRLGVIGGGQLARMMAAPAAELGVPFRVLAEAQDSSAAQVAPHVVGDHAELADLEAFARTVDVVTFDHEHVPTEHLRALESAGVAVRPCADALQYAQDKLLMREAVERLGLPNPEWSAVESLDEILAFGEAHGWPMILKTPRGGYDGKGVLFLRTAEDASRALPWFEDFPELLVEEGVDFSRELSSLVARRPSGETAAWDIAHTIQTDGVCDEVIVPAQDLDPAVAERAQQAALTIAETLGVTGVLAVELFETPGRGEGFVINELAMRPHNTGHWSMDGARTGQFEQHVRAVADLPLGSPERLAEVAVMKNYFGATVPETLSQLPAALQHAPTAKVHHYGKGVRSGRKIGHVNITGRAADLDALRASARDTPGIPTRRSGRPGAEIVPRVVGDARGSTSCPAAVQAGRPPSRTATLSRPATFASHHTRGAHMMPKRSYTTTAVPSEMPRASNTPRTSAGTVCGSGESASEKSSSRSASRAPGTPTELFAGFPMDAHRTTRSASRLVSWSDNQSTETTGPGTVTEDMD